MSRCRDSFLLERFLDRELIYRTQAHLKRLLPLAEGLSHSTYVDETGTNVMAELVRA